MDTKIKFLGAAKKPLLETGRAYRT